MEPFLRSFPVFDGLDCNEAKRLGEAVIEKNFPPKSLVFHVNEKAEYIYLIRKGRIKLYRLTEDGRENIVSILGPGDVFGEFVISEESNYSLFAEAFEETLLCILPRQNFFKLLLKEPAIALTIINNIGKRLALAANSIENLSTFDSSHRLVKLLLQLASEVGEGNNDSVELKLHFTHQDIANMTAMSRQTVTTLINQFKQLSLIRYNGKHIVVYPSRLSKYLSVN